MRKHRKNENNRFEKNVCGEKQVFEKVCKIEREDDDDLEEWMDNFCSNLREHMREHMSGKTYMTVLNPQKVSEMIQVYKELREYVNEHEMTAKVSVEITEFGSGHIELSDKNIDFRDSEVFIRAAVVSENFSVYALMDGGVSINFTFNGLRK